MPFLLKFLLQFADINFVREKGLGGYVMEKDLRKCIEELVKHEYVEDDIYCELIKQKLLYDFSLN